MPKTDGCPDCSDAYMAHGSGGYWYTRYVWGIFPVREWQECETCKGSGVIEVPD